MPENTIWAERFRHGGTGKGGILLPPRSQYLRSINAGNWTNLAIGMVYSITNLSNVNADITVPQVLDNYDPAYLFHFGLAKETAGKINIRQLNNFIGIRGILNATNQLANTNPRTLTNALLTKIENNLTTTSGSIFNLPFTRNGSTPLFSMVGLRFVRTGTIVKVHLQVTISVEVGAGDLSVLPNFIEQLEDDPNLAQGTFTLNSVTDIPTLFIHWPFDDARLALMHIMARRFSI